VKYRPDCLHCGDFSQRSVPVSLRNVTGKAFNHHPQFGCRLLNPNAAKFDQPDRNQEGFIP
jgi:hypothetical protein